MTDRLYLRISLDTAASGSLAKQRAALQAFADPEDFVEYEDRSVSGSKVPFGEREGGARLLADLRKGDRVLVTKIDRAARNTEDLLGLVRYVQGKGADIIFTESNIDTRGAMGTLLLTLLGAVAEFEAALIAERRRESLAAFAAEGRHAVGRAPLGLMSAPNPEGRGLVLRPDPDTAPRLREAVQDLVAGRVSQAECASVLGIGAPGLSRLLRNDRLAGVLPNGTVDPDAAVFSLLEWDDLQRFLDGRPGKSWTRSVDYGPVLACGVCGERLYFNRSKRDEAYSVYKCRRVRHAPGEPSASVTRTRADEHLEGDFIRAFGRLPVTEEVTSSTSDARARAMAEARLRMSRAKSDLDAAESEDEEEAAFRAFRRAKRDLAAAEDLPDETVTARIETGETFADVWRGSDIGDRVALILAAGIRYVVEPGRLDIEQKVHREVLEPDYLAGQLD